MLAWLLNALAQGSMIALIALGYTMVYGVLRLINFAHSEVLMMSGYAAFLVDDRLLGGYQHGGTRGVLISTAFAVVVAVVLGVTIEAVAYRPLRARARGATARIAPLVTAIGVSMLLQSIAQLAFSATPQKFDPRLAPPAWFVIADRRGGDGRPLRPRAPHVDRQGHARRLRQRRGRAPHGHQAPRR